MVWFGFAVILLFLGGRFIFYLLFRMGDTDGGERQTRRSGVTSCRGV